MQQAWSCAWARAQLAAERAAASGKRARERGQRPSTASVQATGQVEELRLHGPATRLCSCARKQRSSHSRCGRYRVAQTCQGNARAWRGCANTPSGPNVIRKSAERALPAQLHSLWGAHRRLMSRQRVRVKHACALSPARGLLHCDQSCCAWGACRARGETRVSGSAGRPTACCCLNALSPAASI